ncbi:hypothetical protein KR222_004314, partial [Zaprionus bogoriensis]
MDVDKICRTCLNLSGPFLSIYDGGSGLVDMLREFTRTNPRREDNLPAMVCLTCISEINHCYSFKQKCESSYRTLRQLLPNALPEEPESSAAPRVAVATAEAAAQTSAVATSCAATQSDEVATVDAEQNTSMQKPSTVLADTSPVDEEDFDYEFAVEQETDEAPSKASAENNIILHVEKDDIKYETEMVYNKSTGELHEQNAMTTTAAALASPVNPKEYKYRLVSNVNGDTYIPVQSQVTTRKSAAKLLQQQEQGDEVLKTEAQTSPLKRSTRRRGAAQLQQQQEEEEQLQQEQEQLLIPVKQPKRAQLGKPIGANGATAPEAEDLKANFHCDRCNAGFVLEKSLIIHRRQNGCTNRNFKCNECERVFVSLEYLNEHQASHAAHTCQECAQQFESKEQLGRHMVQTHKRNLRNQCNVCQKVFTMLSTLRDHMRIHTGEKPFLCNICGKGFTQNANLRQHKLRHSDIKPFKCELCINSFVTKAELTSHARTHTGVKPFECQVCHAKFTTNCSLAKHKRKHTGERPYACDLCPMRFTALNVLKNHRRTHTGERPFVCPFCSKSFTQRGDCQMHQRTHQGNKIYICPVCSEEFKSMNDMRVHLTLHEQTDKRLVPFTLLSNKENGT